MPGGYIYRRSFHARLRCSGELQETRLIFKAESNTKDGFDAGLVVEGWERVFSKVRHVGVVDRMYLDRIPDYRSEGIAEIRMKEKLSFGDIRD